jgi:DNA (cytosine-5)-methyltransferase 1
MDVKLFSFFSGLGFLDLGFEDEGFRIVYVNEFYKPFLSAYRHARQHLAIEPPDFGYCDRSITELLDGKDRRHLSDSVADCRRNGAIVGFIGGPPCPDFSVGGKNRGREGSNGRLSQVYADLICAVKPDFFLFENVKGLWRTSRHRTFYEELKAVWRRNGYALTDRLINTIEYSTPQDRERIILFGASSSLLGSLFHEGGKRAEVVLQELFTWGRYSTYPGREAFKYPWPRRSKFEEESFLTQPHDIPVELTVEYWFRKNDVSSHPNSVHFFRPKA